MNIYYFVAFTILFIFFFIAPNKFKKVDFLNYYKIGLILFFLTIGFGLINTSKSSNRSNANRAFYFY